MCENPQSCIRTGSTPQIRGNTEMEKSYDTWLNPQLHIQSHEGVLGKASEVTSQMTVQGFCTSRVGSIKPGHMCTLDTTFASHRLVCYTHRQLPQPQ